MTRFAGLWATTALVAITMAPGAADAAEAAEAADVEAGLVLAEKWCNACHSIGTEEPRQEDAGPIWADMSDRSTDELLAAFETPHDFMPEFANLTDEDKADLVAYIQSLE